MDFDEYQRVAERSDTFSAEEWRERGAKVWAPAFSEKVMGLSGEAGEAVDKLKKILRDQEGVITEESREGVVKELGDVLWYVASIARYMEVPLSRVAELNIEKLESRLRRNKLHGSGDDR